jgi:DNA helicase HerA-like ATPase
MQDRPALFSTFLLWLLGDLFGHLPEVGDPDKPKLVFFLDEAHLLFADASRTPRRGHPYGPADPVQGRRSAGW